MKDNKQQRRKLSSMEGLGHYVATPTSVRAKTCGQCGKFSSSPNNAQGVCEATRRITWASMGNYCKSWIPSSERAEWRRHSLHKELEVLEEEGSKENLHDRKQDC